ncbi:ammonium transporter [Methanooceanicella nereidis]|nr:hypothetical protein [Methanocella sp. CWC-04]
MFGLLLFVLMVLLVQPASAGSDAGVSQEQFSMLTMLVGVIFWAIMFAIIFFMQSGFMLLEAGSVRSKTAAHIGAKVMIQIGIGIIVFFFVGFAIKGFAWPVAYILPYSATLADGSSWSGVLANLPGDAITGAVGWALSSTSALPWTFMATPDMYIWAFLGSLVFMLTSLAIPGTVFSERMTLKGHVLFVIVYAALIYPVLAWLIWGGLAGSPLIDPNSGILQTVNSIFTPAVDSELGQKLIEYGMVADATGKHFYAPLTDYAGSMIHILGGIVGLIGAWYLGPRIGKFIDGRAQAIPGHNIPLAVFGALLLAFCFFAFNGGSAIANYFSGPLGEGAGVRGLYIADYIFSDLWWVVIVTTMSMAGGVVGSMLGSSVLKLKPDPLVIANGMLAGLVAICAGTGFVHPVYGLVIGLVAGFQFPLVLRFVEETLKIDDAIGTIPCHTMSGIVGVLMAGIWGQLFWWGIIPMDWVHPGGSMIGGSFIPTIGIQIIGILILLIWAIPIGLAAFWVIDRLVGARVSKQDELCGLDIAEHGVTAYPEFNSKQTDTCPKTVEFDSEEA